MQSSISIIRQLPVQDRDSIVRSNSAQLKPTKEACGEWHEAFRWFNDRLFTCPACGLNAWAKPSAHLICRDCGQPMAGRNTAASPAGDQLVRPLILKRR